MATVLQHLGAACLRAREDAGLRQIDIAVTASVSHTIVSRFELGTGRPRNLDALVAAYGTECAQDPFDLWMEALHSWRDNA